MLLILGTENCRLDTTGRFKLPIALKRQLQSDDNRFVIRPSIFAPCLELWTYASFEKEIEKLTSQLNPYSIEDRKLLRKMTAGNIIEMDGNDRLVIPLEQKARLGDTKDIVLQSIGGCIEIWDSEAYRALDGDEKSFADMANERLGRLSADLKSPNGSL